MASVVTRTSPDREIEGSTDTAVLVPEDSFVTGLSDMEIQGMILAAIRSIQERNQRANFESVAVYIEKKHGLNKSDIILQINKMINPGKINSVWFRGGESFRIDETESQNSASNVLPDNNSSSPPLSNNVSRSTLHFTENMSYGPP